MSAFKNAEDIANSARLLDRQCLALMDEADNRITKAQSDLETATEETRSQLEHTILIGQLRNRELSDIRTIMAGMMNSPEKFLDGDLMKSSRENLTNLTLDPNAVGNHANWLEK